MQSLIDVPAAYGGYRVVVKNGLNVSALELLEDIQKLQAENAELKKQSQWISVEDELPELNKTVMIDSGSGFDFARFNGDYWTRKAWPLGYAPKYWRPLPTPPEGE